MTALKGARIREFQPGDEEQILSLVKNMLLTYGFRWEPEGPDSDVLDPGSYLRGGGTFLVLQTGDQILGTIAARKLDEGRVELCRMYLHPAYWGEGWGSDLLSALVDWAKVSGFEQIELETDPRFDRSIGFYERKGFRRLPAPEGGWPLEGPLRYVRDLRPRAS